MTRILKMFYNNLFVCIILVVGLTTATNASSISKEPSALEFNNNDEELETTYDETFEVQGTQDADCMCKNGFCVKEGGKDVCTCPQGWAKVKSDQCKECECGKGINCTYSGFIFQDKYCFCPDGKELKNEACKDYCVKDPCKNGGTCKNVKDGYACNCPAEFFGKHCEIRDFCDSNSCKNGGTCINQAEGYYCNCPEGFSGSKCDEKECDCINGECHKNADGNVRCVCNPGFGKYSEHECRACDCGKGFNCTFDVGFFNEDKYCLCPGGVKVKNDKCKDPCTNNPCNNGGTCEVDGESFKCRCKEPYSGAKCERNPCSSNPCNNGGTCKVEGSKSYQCMCNMGFFGTHCEKIDHCYGKTCSGNGICLNKETSYECQCNAGYVGTNCEMTDHCYGKTCSGNGICRNKETYQCMCNIGFFGIDCEKTDHCHGKKCSGNGICINKETSYECQCNAGYVGTDCEKIDETCGKRGDDVCRSVFKKCEKRVNDNYLCGDCLKSYIRDVDGSCVFASCEYIGSYMCSKMFRKCADQPEIGYKCGGCLNDSFTEDYSTKTCIKATCENIGGYRCESLKRECGNDHNGYQCGKCKKGFVEFEGRKECVKECSCENAECKYNDKMEPYCSCFRGFGLWTSNVCKACNCGKGVGCFFGIRNRVMNKYCECPNGNKVIDGPCTVTCKNIGYEYCGEMNRTCSENSDGYECGVCKDGYVEDADTKKCVIATCANEGNRECGNLGRHCLTDDTLSSYKCGGCLKEFIPVEDSDRCTLDLCLSSPCKNSGICKLVNDSFICFCHNPFFGETCELEVVSTTTLPSTTTNFTTPSLPDDYTNSTAVDYTSNITSDFNWTTEKIETTETTVGDTTSFYKSTTVDVDSSNITSDFNRTTEENERTETTVGDTTSTDTTTMTSPTIPTTTTSEIPTKSDRSLKFIFRNVYTVKNLTEVIVKSSYK